MNIPDFSSLSILVIGDVMLDRYWQGSCNRISPEAPVPVVKKNAVDNRLGGAANVANNLARLGIKTHLLGIIGNDEEGICFKALMSDAGIENQCIESPSSNTITKLRLVSQNQQLLRVDSEESFSATDQELLLQAALNNLDNQSAVIISDYDKGSIPLPQALIEKANALNIPVVIDPKGSNYQKYQGATTITPNLSEFETVVGHCKDEFELFEKGAQLREALNLDSLLITLSEKGVAIIKKDTPPARIPTKAREVFDVTGAGDTVIALIATGLGAQYSIEDAVALGNIGAGIVVGKLGTSFVTKEELIIATPQQEDINHHILSKEQLPFVVKSLKDQGKRIVMTNGCFDILHPGHVRYLQQAASLGDYLIIVVNDDNSVKRLKGESRPVNNLDARMQMLASIKGVSWVTSFEEDTPIEVINTVMPDVLVKGGDYIAEELVGYKEVTENGGTVAILPFKDGFSTTKLIEKIQCLPK